MKALRFAILVAVAALTLTGCVTPHAAMKSFLGHHSSELIGLWGPPQEKNDDGNGGQIWTYYEHRQWTTPGHSTTSAYGMANTHGTVYNNPYGSSFNANTTAFGTAHTTYTPPETHGYRAHRTFFIDSSGRIYRYGWKGL
jgi:hypothetical protein